MDDDLEEIRRLDEIIKAEGLENENLEFYDESSDESYDEEEEEDETVKLVDNKSEDTNLVVYSNVISKEIEIDEDYEEQSKSYDNVKDFASLIPHLTFEEYDVINKCENPKLKDLLILNRLKKVQLTSMNAKYHNLLQKCNSNLKYEMDKSKRLKEIGTSKNFHVKIGYPYFHDKQAYPCPANADIIKKIKSSEIQYPQCKRFRRWSPTIEINLKSQIMGRYFKGVLAEKQKELEYLRTRDGDSEKILELENKITEMKSDIDHIEPPPLGSDKHLDWTDIAFALFSDMSQAVACKACWNLILHPHLNNSIFKEEEQAVLVQLVIDNNFQNWNKISIDLNTNRSSFSVCRYFYSRAVMSNNKFSEAEDKKLKKLVETNRIGDYIPWTKIAYQFETRSKPQLYHRYQYINSRMNIKIGPFSEAEDILLMCLVNKHGEDFDKISQHMKHRAKTQLRAHYKNYLKPTELILGNWTLLDDRLILDHVNTQGARNWAEIAKKLNRNSAHVRHRYNCIKRQLASNKNLTLESLTRKCYLKSDQFKKRNKFTMTSVQHYIENESLPDMSQFQFKTKTGRPLRTAIDVELINFFRTTSKIRKARKLKSVMLDALDSCAKNVNLLFNYLNVKIKIPDVLNESDSIDKLDVEILQRIKVLHNVKDECAQTSPMHVDIPPNLNTLQILRALLLQYQNVTTNSQPNISVEFIQWREPYDNSEFKKRFKALLKWPCIMSITEAPKELLYDSKFERETINKPEPGCSKIKKPGRKKKDLTKIHKMNASRIKRIAEQKKKATEKPTNILVKAITNPTSSSDLQETTVPSLPSSSTVTEHPTELVLKTAMTKIVLETDIPQCITNDEPIKNVEEVEQIINNINKIPTSNSTRFLIKVDKATIDKLRRSKTNIGFKRKTNVVLDNTSKKLKNDVTVSTSKQ